MANASKHNPDPSYARARAFLVVRRGGRWTDLLRLSPDRAAIIGRSSSNQIVIRSHQASRQHAEIRWDEGGWWVRDLASRNGTVVDGSRISEAQPLNDGTCIEVAGCAMTFMTNVSDALTSSGHLVADAATSQQADDQLTMDGPLNRDDLGHDAITHRSAHSRFLDSDINSPANDQRTLDAWQSLFGLAYRLASTESIEEASQSTLAMITTAIRGSGGGVFLPLNARSLSVATSPAPASLVSFLSNDNRSYRPPAASIVHSVVVSGNAVIARNIADDNELQDADSRGDYSVTTAIVAPITLKRAKDCAAETQGYLHLFSNDPTTDFSATELDLAIAAAGVLAAAIDNLRTRGQLARSLKQSRRQIECLREQLADSIQIIGNSDAINRVKSLIARVARTNTTVLIRGESGVGKELVAAAIHHASQRRDAPIVCLNCAALSPTLLESELFGHEKGAFTGATEQKKGKFESANGGTLMLDEIGEMSIDLQAKLLRVLEGHSFERLGGQHPIRVDVRLIAATNRDLPLEVQQGTFRADLYYRLNVVEIIVPPLRERRDDILLVAEHYLRYFSEKTARPVDGFTTGATRALLAHSWPGNIRELKNVIERAVVLGINAIIDTDDLNIATVDDAPTTATIPAQPQIVAISHPVTPRKLNSLNEIEQQHLIAVLRDVNGNKSRAAVVLGIERSTLDRKLKRFEIKPDAYRAE